MRAVGGLVILFSLVGLTLNLLRGREHFASYSLNMPLIRRLSERERWVTTWGLVVVNALLLLLIAADALRWLTSA